MTTVSTVVLNCCKGDKPSQWEYPIFGPLLYSASVLKRIRACIFAAYIWAYSFISF